MAVSALDLIAEGLRQEATGDDKYAKKGRYVFVLSGPPGAGPFSDVLGLAQFPLVINPETFEYVLPFAAEITPLQDGGVVSDEHGIVIGELTIAGSTGFKLRTNLGEFSSSRGDGEFTGGVDPGGPLVVTGDPLGGVSGQMHFWRLASRCFDGYSALKKDPKSASQTRMEFHSTKEDLHLTIVPRSFTLSRSAAKERVSYRYNIRAAVVGPSGTVGLIPSPDVALIDSFKNTIGKIRSGIQSIGAAVDDLTASLDDIRRAVTSVAGILDDVGGIVDSFSDVVNGVAKFADIPKAFINSTAGLVASAADFAGTVTGFPASVAQSFMEIEDGLDRLGVAARNHFRESMDETSRKYERLTRGYQEGRDTVRDTQASGLKESSDSGQGRLSVQEAFGGAVRAGDVKRGRMDPIQSRSRLQPGRFKGFEERVVGQGDTIQSLAAKYMGNAWDYPAIAMVNQLKAPYITSGPKIPGTLQPGSKVIVPIANTTRSPDTLTTGEAELGESQAAALMGVDFELEKLADGTYGWAVDTAGGSTDARHVSGVDNLGQGIGSRFRTEQGHNILYPTIGLPRAVGNTQFNDALEDIRHEARRQLLADSRVKSVTSFKFSTEQDAVSLEASVVPVGFTSDRVISRTLT
jgi:hypothetical protein